MSRLKGKQVDCSRNYELESNEQVIANGRKIKISPDHPINKYKSTPEIKKG
ncbi:MAG: hypothetical protein ABIH91_03700 [Candidatus Omnitrophota bacterium]